MFDTSFEEIKEKYFFYCPSITIDSKDPKDNLILLDKDNTQKYVNEIGLITIDDGILRAIKFKRPIFSAVILPKKDQKIIKNYFLKNGGDKKFISL